MRILEQPVSSPVSRIRAEKQRSRALGHGGLKVQLAVRDAGPIALEPLSDHRVLIHSGAPVSGVCGRARFTYTHGDVDLVPAGFSDTWHHDNASTSLILRLAPSLLQQAAADMGLDPDHVGMPTRHQLKDPRIEHIAWALEAERSAGQPSGGLYADSLGLALAVHLLGQFPAPGNTGVRRRQLSAAQLARVTDYIESHIDRDLSLVRLAALAGVSPTQLKAAFRQTTGLPVHEYVIRRRVERAKALLLRGKLAASEIALEAGFSHQSHMARCMRRILGVTPRVLMQQHRAIDA
ncbi:MAG: AraC family transcriptional regulator [Polyangiales bacterium]